MSAIQRTEGLPVRGDLRVTVRDATTGRSLRRFLIKNTITEKGLTALINLMRQITNYDPTGNRIATLQVGTGNAPPDRLQTALVAPVAPPVALTIGDANVSGSTTADPVYELRILVTLGANDANGNTLQEAALFMANNEMFSRQTHPAIPKSSAIVVDYDWRISITA